MIDDFVTWVPYIQRCVRLNASNSNFTVFSRADWEDIEQEAIIRIWNKRHLFNSDLDFKPWIKTVVYRHIANSIRSKVSRLKNNPIHFSLVTKELSGGEVSYEPDALDFSSLMPTLYEELSLKLSENQNKLLNLFLSGYSIKEAADELHLSRRRVYGIRKELQKIYKNIIA